MGLLIGIGSSQPKYPYNMWYGVQGDKTSGDSNLTRVGNLDLHRTLPVQSRIRRFVENTDGSVKYYLHATDSRKKEGGAPAIIDSTDGNVMLEILDHYFRYEQEGTKWVRAWSLYPIPGFTHIPRQVISPWFATINLTTSKAVSGCFLTWDGNEIARDTNGFVKLTDNAANFRGGSGAGDSGWDGTYHSMLGMAHTNISKSSARNACENGTHIGAYRAFNSLAWLMACEYANLNGQLDFNASLTADGFHQGGIGAGPSVASGEWNTWGSYKPFIPNGVTATLGNQTGVVNYTIKGWTGGDKVVAVNSYRGFELPFEYLWMLADDLLIHHAPDTETADGESIAYVCDDPTKFTSHSDSATTVPDGYEAIATLPRADGWTKQLSHHSKGYSFPETLGGGANVGPGDYYYQPSTTASGWYGGLLAGGAYFGTSAGWRCLLTHYRSSYSTAAVGFRLCRN